MALRYVQFLCIGPLQTILVTYFLWQEIGVSSIIGVTVFLAFVPLQGTYETNCNLLYTNALLNKNIFIFRMVGEGDI